MTEQLPVRRYCSAGGVVLDSSGEYMLVLVRPGRTGLDGLPEVRLPKGHIEPDESRPQAALREAWEEAGLPQLNILADLGHQTVEFDWKGYHIVRDESCFLMTVPSAAPVDEPETQFRRLWLTWQQALDWLTFEAEREWIRRARAAWHEQLENVPNQNS